MCKEINGTFKEETLLWNAFKTFNYLFEAFVDEDFDTAKLELQELDLILERLKGLKKKREKREKLLNIVLEMQARGIKIELGNSLLKNSVKNADEKRILTQKYKKRQQA